MTLIRGKTNEDDDKQEEESKGESRKGKRSPCDVRTIFNTLKCITHPPHTHRSLLSHGVVTLTRDCFRVTAQRLCPLPPEIEFCSPPCVE